MLRSAIPNLEKNLGGSYSLVGVGKFNLLFLWLIGVVSLLKRRGLGDETLNLPIVSIVVGTTMETIGILEYRVLRVSGALEGRGVEMR